jgi:putative transcriptional regulator
VTVGRAVPQLPAAVDGEEPVFVGGPVAPSSVVVLAEFEDPAPAGMLVVGRIGFPAADADLDELARATTRRRVYAGLAGWGEGQLDAELKNGDWIAHSALADDVFTERPGDLWSSVLQRKGQSYALMARMPLDPSMN